MIESVGMVMWRKFQELGIWFERLRWPRQLSVAILLTLPLAFLRFALTHRLDLFAFIPVIILPLLIVLGERARVSPRMGKPMYVVGGAFLGLLAGASIGLLITVTIPNLTGSFMPDSAFFAMFLGTVLGGAVGYRIGKKNDYLLPKPKPGKLRPAMLIFVYLALGAVLGMALSWTLLFFRMG